MILDSLKPCYSIERQYRYEFQLYSLCIIRVVNYYSAERSCQTPLVVKASSLLIGLKLRQDTHAINFINQLTGDAFYNENASL